MKKQHKESKWWRACPSCHQLVYTTGFGIGNHACPPKAVAKRDAELDMVVEEELSTWNADLERFWNSSDVKFMEYIIQEKKDGN